MVDGGGREPYQAEIPPKSTINTGVGSENSNAEGPGNKHYDCLSDMHAEFYILEMVDADFHFGVLLCCVVSKARIKFCC